MWLFDVALDCLLMAGTSGSWQRPRRRRATLQALQDAKAKHERIELLHRQVRLMTTDDD
jgi:hypothetical protein